jgi:hypothetical protein
MPSGSGIESYYRGMHGFILVFDLSRPHDGSVGGCVQSAAQWLSKV